MTCNNWIAGTWWHRGFLWSSWLVTLWSSTWCLTISIALLDAINNIQLGMNKGNSGISVPKMFGNVVKWFRFLHLDDTGSRLGYASLRFLPTLPPNFLMSFLLHFLYLNSSGRFHQPLLCFKYLAATQQWSRTPRTTWVLVETSNFYQMDWWVGYAFRWQF